MQTLCNRSLHGSALQQRVQRQVYFRHTRVAPAPARRSIATVVCQAASSDDAAITLEPQAVTDSKPKSKVAAAHLNFARGSPHKVRRILDVIRGKTYKDALFLLAVLPYRACEPILSTLLSAGANAKNNNGLSKANLVISECFADGGPSMKRFRPRAKGRGFKILKPTFHLTIKVSEQEPEVKTKRSGRKLPAAIEATPETAAASV